MPFECDAKLPQTMTKKNLHFALPKSPASFTLAKPGLTWNCLRAAPSC